jgi:hypothetical protein
VRHHQFASGLEIGIVAANAAAQFGLALGD